MTPQQQAPFQASTLLQTKTKPLPPALSHHVQQHVVHETAASPLAPIPESAAIGPADGPEVLVTSCFGWGLIIGSCLSNHMQIFTIFFFLGSEKIGFLC